MGTKKYKKQIPTSTPALPTKKERKPINFKELNRLIKTIKSDVQRSEEVRKKAEQEKLLKALAS